LNSSGKHDKTGVDPGLEGNSRPIPSVEKRGNLGVS
jgi:hypothetical protein